MLDTQTLYLTNAIGIEKMAAPHQRELCMRLNHDTMDDLRYCSNPMLQQYTKLPVNALPIRLFDFPL